MESAAQPAVRVRPGQQKTNVLHDDGIVPFRDGAMSLMS